MSPAIANPSSSSRSAITRLLLAAVVILASLSLVVALAGHATAGADAKVTVNSIANIDDGECEGPPNNNSVGNCTLHEAIHAVNNGHGDIINFHPPVFTKEAPGLIDLCTGDGQLPPLMRDVKIDSKDSGVILDGGNKDKEHCTTGTAEFGLWALDFDNGFDFELNGGKNFTIRNIDEVGIYICGGDCFDGQSLGTIEITGVIVDNIGGVGILIEGSNLQSGSITNSEISTNFEDGIYIGIFACAGNDCRLTDSVVEISGNRIQAGVEDDIGGAFAGGCCDSHGVNIDYQGVLNIENFPAGAAGTSGGTKITANVSGNEVINGLEDGVSIDFVGCGQDAGVNFHVDENETINGRIHNGVDISVFADDCPPEFSSSNFTATVTVNGNGDIESEGTFDPQGEAVSVTAYT